MPRFLYKAKNNKGEIVTGTVKANSEVEAEKILLKHSLVATDITNDNQKTKTSVFAYSVPLGDKAVFTRQLATMLSAGLSLTKAISILAKQAKADQLRAIFLEIYRDLEEGYSLSTSLAKHPEAFDKVYVSIVSSGESTGKLDTVLGELANQLENDQDFVSRVRSSLYYPGFIFIVMIAAAIFLLSYVVPKLEVVFKESGQNLPAFTQFLLNLSNFMQDYWWGVAGGLVLFIMLIISWFRTATGTRFLHNVQITIPGLSTLFEGIYMYRFTRVMSMLVGAGVPLLDALRIGASVVGNEVYEESIMTAANQVEKGVPLSTQLMKDPFFPVLVGQMVAVGEETGELDKVLNKVSDYYRQSTNEITKSISSLVEPLVLIMVGLGVAVIVFAIYIPIYQLNQFQS